MSREKPHISQVIVGSLRSHSYFNNTTQSIAKPFDIALELRPKQKDCGTHQNHADVEFPLHKSHQAPSPIHIGFRKDTGVGGS